MGPRASRRQSAAKRRERQVALGMLTLGALGWGGCNALFGIDALEYNKPGAGQGAGGAAPGGSGPGGSAGTGHTGGGAGEGQGLPLGAVCTGGADCASGHCADERCCDAPCDRDCERCDEPGTEGSCTPSAAGTDPDQQCAPGVCDGAAACAVGDVLWAKRFGDSNEQVNFMGAVDTAGNLLIGGGSTGSFDFGGGALVGWGDADVFVAQLAPDGTHRWSDRFGDGGSDYGDYGAHVAVDPAGAMLVTGYCDGPINFGGAELPAAGMLDSFVAKLSPTGSHVWSRRFGDSIDQWGLRIASDSAGNVIAAGWFRGAIDFGVGTLTSAGATDIYVAKLSPDGTALWSRRFGGQNDQELYGVATDGAGNVIVTGFYESSIDFGGGALPTATDQDGFIAKLSADGGHLWSLGMPGTGDQLLRNPAVDSAGNVLVTGQFAGSTSIAGLALTSAGGTDGFVLKLDPSGGAIWVKQFGDGDEQAGRYVGLDDADHVLLAGQFKGSVDLGGGPLTSESGHDALVAKLAADGTHLWSKRFGGDGDQAAWSVSAGPDRAVLIVGWLRNSMTIGTDVLTSAGQGDIFAAKLSP